MVTIFTPTYNRAYLLHKLHESLCMQTNKNFEWLIIDDGSTDNTEDIVRSWLQDSSFTIRYIKQNNGGKHRAINRGVKEAYGELFFIVDSDDYLTPDAVQWILDAYNDIKGDGHFAGLSGIRISPKGQRIGGGADFGVIDTDPLTLRLKYKISGDMAEVLRTNVIREFPLLEVPGEKFCTEALLWMRLSQQYILRYFHHGIYVCEYLPDGLTASIVRVRRNSPIASMTYYSEYAHTNHNFTHRFKGCINYWRFAPLRLYNKSKDFKMLSIFSFMAWPIGVTMRLIDRKKI